MARARILRVTDERVVHSLLVEVSLLPSGGVGVQSKRPWPRLFAFELLDLVPRKRTKNEVAVRVGPGEELDFPGGQR